MAIRTVDDVESLDNLIDDLTKRLEALEAEVKRLTAVKQPKPIREAVAEYEKTLDARSIIGDLHPCCRSRSDRETNFVSRSHFQAGKTSDG